jgi:hypothetical protein
VIESSTAVMSSEMRPSVSRLKGSVRIRRIVPMIALTTPKMSATQT